MNNRHLKQEKNTLPELIPGIREAIIDIIHSHINSTAWAEEEADRILSLKYFTRSREILSLRRRTDGLFEFWVDGELVETYEAQPDTWEILLPIKLWRYFKGKVRKRIEAETAPMRIE